MAPSLVALGAAALAYTSAAAAASSYQITDTYDSTNFFDKFNFFVSNFNTGNYNDVDPTSGYVNYRDNKTAWELGLVDIQYDEVYFGVNHQETFNPKGKGRDSVRIESKTKYTQGLFIAHFSHLPKPECGLWPAFWMYGDPWPTVGEFDIYEGWNKAPANTITLHADHAATVGSCKLTQTGQTGTVTSATNCDNYFSNPPQQYEAQGCGTAENNNLWGSELGAVCK
jgi:beta-glucanase (GH16 family)